MKPREAMLCRAVPRVESPNTAVITFEGREEWELDLIGCNLQNSGCRKNSCASLGPTFTIVIQRGQTGIAAVYCRKPVKLRNHTTSTDYSFLVGIFWPEKSEEPSIDLDKNWFFADPDRIGAIRNNQLEVNIGGVNISTGDERFRHTSGDLICQYLAGDISADALIAGAKLDQTAQNHLAGVNALGKRIHTLLEQNTRLQKDFETEKTRAIRNAATLANWSANEDILVTSMKLLSKDLFGAKDRLGQRHTPSFLLFVDFKTDLLEMREALGKKVYTLEQISKSRFWWWLHPIRLIRACRKMVESAKEKKFYTEPVSKSG